MPGDQTTGRLVVIPLKIDPNFCAYSEPYEYVEQGFTLGELRMVGSGTLAPLHIFGMLPSPGLLRCATHYHNLRRTTRSFEGHLLGGKPTLQQVIDEFGTLMIERA